MTSLTTFLLILLAKCGRQKSRKGPPRFHAPQSLEPVKEVYYIAELTFRKGDYPGKSNVITGTLRSRELSLADGRRGRELQGRSRKEFIYYFWHHNGGGHVTRNAGGL